MNNFVQIVDKYEEILVNFMKIIKLKIFLVVTHETIIIIMNSLGFSIFNEETKILLFILLLTLCFSFIYRLIPLKMLKTKHFYNCIFGVVIVFLSFDKNIIHQFFVTCIGFLLIKFVPVRINHVITIGFLFFYLILCHVYLFFKKSNYLSSFVGVQMIVTLKLSTIPFNLLDWNIINKNEKNKKGKHKLTKEQLNLAIDKKPTLLQYFGYSFYFPTILNSPSFEYKHYLDFVENEKKIPLDFRTILIKFIASISCFLVYVIFHLLGNDMSLLQYENYSKKNGLKLIFPLVIMCFVWQCGQRYFCWYWSELCAIVTGLGFSGINEGGYFEWENIKQVDMIAFQTSTSFRQSIIYWNISVYKYSKRYIYSRLPTKYESIRRAFSGFIFCVWHGLNFGYLNYYLSGTLLLQLYVGIYKILKNTNFLKNGKFKGEHPYFWYLLKVLLIVIMQFVIMYFMFIPWYFGNSWKEIHAFYKHFYYSPHIILILSVVCISLSGCLRDNRRKYKHQLKNE